MGKTKKNPILEKLGLDVEEVRAAFSVPAPEAPKKRKNYLYRDDQMRMNRRMNRWERLIFARFAGGMHPKQISHCIGVSEETVRMRLRVNGFFSSTS